MEKPIKLADTEQRDLEHVVSAMNIQLQQADRLPNLADKIEQLERILTCNSSARDRLAEHSRLSQVEREIQDRLFDLRNVEKLMTRIEERLGQGSSEPVDLTLQQTFDVVQQLRHLSQTAPNDERLAMVATNVCEGLESFVTAILADPQSGENAHGGSVGAGPSDLTLALEVIDTLRTCPGGDRTPTYKTLRQQFIGAACRSTWNRVDSLFDVGLDRATRKGYLHEALTIWTLIPELAENAGSPRLSHLPEDIKRTIQQALMREVIGSVSVGDRQGLLDGALLIKELGEDYLTMVPAISVSEAQEDLGLQVTDSLIRRVRTELATVDSRQDMELCMSAISVFRTIPGLQHAEGLQKLSWRITISSWRLQWKRLTQFFARTWLRTALAVVVILAGIGGYIGIATLVKRLYDMSWPLAI